MAKLLPISQRARFRFPWRPMELWGHLTEPAPSTRPAERRQAQLLSSVLLALILLGLLGFVLIVLGYAHATSLPIDLLATGVLLPLYGTSRTRHHTLAATLTVIAVPTSVFIYGTFDSKGNLLDFLVLGVVLSSLFLSKRSTVVVFAVSLLGIPVLSLLPTQVPFVDVLDEWFLIACIGALAIVTGGLRQHDLRQIEQQSRELADDIAKRRRVEEALNQSNEKLVETVKTLEQHNSEITLLNQMGDLLQTCLMSQEAHAVVAQFAQRLFPDQPGALGIINYSRNLVEVVAVWGEPLPSDRAFAPDDCLALRRGQAYTVTDPRAGLICRHVAQPLSSGYCCIPMMAQGEEVGVLHFRIDNCKRQPGVVEEGSDPSQDHLRATMAEHIALALTSLKLRETLRNQAIRDPLTGLFNRRYMEETLARELSRAVRKGVPLGLIMFDLDQLKTFNDTFGHAAGDRALRAVGACLQGMVRAEDVTCRHGGDEFIVILPEAPLRETARRADQMRMRVKQLTVEYHEQSLGGLTVSLGVGTFPDCGSTVDELLEVVDAALLSAKRAGRDQVRVAPSLGILDHEREHGRREREHERHDREHDKHERQPGRQEV